MAARLRPTAVVDELAREAGGLVFGPPVAHVYNPLVHARVAHHAYLRLGGAASGRMLHPSPASPAAYRGWDAQAEGDLRGLGVDFR